MFFRLKNSSSASNKWRKVNEGSGMNCKLPVEYTFAGRRHESYGLASGNRLERKRVVQNVVVVS